MQPTKSKNATVAVKRESLDALRLALVAREGHLRGVLMEEASAALARRAKEIREAR
jgi:hypothetical protein